MAGQADFAIGIVAVAPSPATTGTSIVLQSGQGADMPTPPFYATASPQGYTATKANAEKIRVTNIVGDTLTIQRAQAPTTAKSIDIGWVIYNGVYKDNFDAKVDSTDPRLSDDRNPTDGSVTNAKIAPGAGISISKLELDPTLRSNHTGAQSADTLVDGSTNKVYTSTEKTKLSGISAGATVNSTDATLKDRANHTGTQTASTISDFNTAADARITAQKGVASGLATLDSTGKVTSTQVPAGIDEVVEYANFAALPGSGTTAKIYITTNDNKQYRWSGTQYIEIVSTPGSTDAVTEGTSNLYFTTSRAAAAAPVQSVNGSQGTVTITKSSLSLGNVDNTSDANKPVSTAQQVALDSQKNQLIGMIIALG